MGCFAKCDECGEGLDAPSAADAVVGSIYCVECGSEHVIHSIFRRSAIEDLVERLEKLEGIVQP